MTGSGPAEPAAVLPGAAPAVPPAPPGAAQVFGDRLPVLEAYAALLAGAGVERGLLGPREAPRLWERHLLNCAGLGDLLAPGQRVADLGAGAGLPGLVLAAARPDLHVVLVEPLLRRAVFLTEAVDALGLPNAEVRRARAEELVADAPALALDAVTARAVAPVARLVGWALPLLPVGGRLLALKGARAQEELDAAEESVRRAGGTGARVIGVGEDSLGTWGQVVVVERGTPASPGGGRAPRRGRAAGAPRPQGGARGRTAGSTPSRAPRTPTTPAPGSPSTATSRTPAGPASPPGPTSPARRSPTARRPGGDR